MTGQVAFGIGLAKVHRETLLGFGDVGRQCVFQIHAELISQLVQKGRGVGQLPGQTRVHLLGIVGITVALQILKLAGYLPNLLDQMQERVGWRELVPTPCLLVGL